MINRKNFVDQPVKNDRIRYDNVTNITTGQGDDYTISCLRHYFYFINYYKMITIDLSKQQALDANTKSIMQTNFTESLDRAAKTTIFFVIEEVKETIFDFSQEL